MSRDELYLKDILRAAEHIERFLDGVATEQFEASELIRSAVLQKMIVIGEAAASVGAATRQRAPQIPWTRIVGFRNIAVHRYFSVNWHVVWITATVDVPALKSEMRSSWTDESNGHDVHLLKADQRRAGPALLWSNP